jgi:predicted transcriptional regulator
MEENSIGCATYRFIINKTYLNLLLSLEFGSAKMQELAKKGNMSYFHLINVIKELQKEGIVEKERDIHSYDISLTEKGKKLVQGLLKVKSIIDESEIIPIKTDSIPVKKGRDKHE